jgi:hypothetical protein
MFTFGASSAKLITYVNSSCSINSLKFSGYFIQHKFNVKNTVFLHSTFLNTMAKLRQVTILHVRTSWTTRLPLDVFWWNLIFETFFKTLSRKFNVYYIPTRKTSTLYKDVSTFMKISRKILLRREMFRQSCRKYQNTHFIFNNFFQKISPFMR